MFSFSTGDEEKDKKIQTEMALLLLSFGEPADENIQAFDVLRRSLTSVCTSSDSEDFKSVLRVLTQIYESETTRSPVWKLLSAQAIFGLYTGTIPGSGLPLSHPHISQCLLWAESVINLPKINNPLDTKSKLLACDWVAGIYKRRGESEAKNENIKPDSKNPLIQLSLQYYEKAAEVVNAAQESKFDNISFTLSRLAEVCEEFLPENATLDDEDTRRLIYALERVIEFHSNVPDDKKTMTKYVGPRHAMLELDECTGKKNEMEVKLEEAQLDIDEPPTIMWELSEKWLADKISTIAMGKLGKLYSRVPKNSGEEPDFQRAVIWLDKANGRRYTREAALGDNLDKPEIKKAREEVKIKLAETVELIHDKLIDLTNSYLNKRDIDPEKGKIFSTLKNILENSDGENKSKHERIIMFKDTFKNIDKEMLFAHRTDDWKRYAYNAFSFCTGIPAIVRACISYAQYGTFRFWKSDSQQAAEYAEENYSKLDLGKFTT